MKLYENTTWPVIAYGASEGINPVLLLISVQARAMRFVLGIGRFTHK
jgi:hypothetical protein